jgi:carboxyl-terminal processing protease
MRWLGCLFLCAVMAAPALAGDEAAATVLASERWRGLMAHLERMALRPVDERELADGCRRHLALAPAMVPSAAIDLCIEQALAAAAPGSTATPPAEWKSLRAAPRNWVGIGLELGRKGPGEPLQIVSPIEGAPAARAGVRPRDQVLAIDGQDIRNLRMEDVIVRLRGEAGSRIELTLQREGETAPVVLSIVREPIRVATVRRRLVTAEVGYLRISQFGSTTAEELLRHVNGWLDGTAPAPDRLLLDLRGNPGGLLEAVVDTASLFARDADAPVAVLHTREQAEPLTLRYFGRPPGRGPRGPAAREWLLSVPIVVMVDARTYSAAEALAQFLREAAGARVWGERTAGLAAVRTQVELAGESAVQIVTGELASPGGVRWADTGLVPDGPLPDLAARGEYGAAGDPALEPALQALAALPPRVGEGSATQRSVHTPVIVTPVVPPARSGSFQGGQRR